MGGRCTGADYKEGSCHKAHTWKLLNMSRACSSSKFGRKRQPSGFNIITNFCGKLTIIYEIGFVTSSNQLAHNLATGLEKK